MVKAAWIGENPDLSAEKKTLIGSIQALPSSSFLCIVFLF
jgi:hypothetical protein